MSTFGSIYELSDQIGLSTKWIQRHAKAGKLPFVRDRNQMRFPIAEAVAAAKRLAGCDSSQQPTAAPDGSEVPSE